MTTRAAAPAVPVQRFSVALALATLSGTLWFLACTPYDLSALGWIAAVPMLMAIDRAPSLRQALFLGWWAGVVEHAGGFYWFIDTLERFASLSLIGSLLIFGAFCAYQGLIQLVFALLTRVIRTRAALPFVVLAPLLIAVCEWALPQLFPCGQFITQAWHPLVIQIAALTGPYGVSALLLLVNGAVYDWLRSGRAARVPAFGAALVVVVILAFGAWHMRQMDRRIAEAPMVRIGIVQPNAAPPISGRLSEQQAVDRLAALQVQTRRLEQAGAQLVVWSEGSYPFRLARGFTDDHELAPQRRVRRGFDVPVVIGALTADSVNGEAHNSALLINSAGRTVARYDKTRLVVFGEYIPDIGFFPWLRRRLPEGAGRFTRGDGPHALIAEGITAQAIRLAPVICYEDILPGYLRRTAALKPDLLVNLTSDSWFGARTEPWQHLALSVFASVELGTGLVRAVNTGVSGFIDPNGRLVGSTYAVDPYLDLHPADGVLYSVALVAGGDTVYAAFGNVFVFACLASLVAIVAISRRKVYANAGRWRIR